MGTSGHPTFPSDESEIDDGFLTDDEAPTLPLDWAATEHVRRSNALIKQEEGMTYDTDHPVQPKSAGVWRGLELETTAEAANALRWVNRGESGAYHWMHHWLVVLAGDPTAPRSQGQAYLLAHQSDATNRFRLITTGSRSAPNKQKSARRFTPAPQQEQPQQPPTQQQQPPQQPPQQQLQPAPTTTTPQDTDVEMFDGDDLVRLSASDAPDDVTTTAITDDDADTTRASATHTSFSTAIARYGSIDTVHWPLGFRVNKQEYALIGVGVRAKPYSKDVAAWFAFNALSPQRAASGPSIDRARFTEIAFRVISVAGAYKRIAELGEYEYDTLPVEHYPFATANIGWSHVVAWFIQHGIDVDSDALGTLESFARARRNAKQARADPMLTDFSGSSPRRPDDVRHIAIAEVVHWDELEHVPRPGIATSYPTSPAKSG
ncbi:hypothetical protein C8R46DRAFT_1213139 [Mycena filopes]|nr:hypothetical protein C8R46DRAFT_1213139 [Mycena filopes]